MPLKTVRNSNAMKLIFEPHAARKNASVEYRIAVQHGVSGLHLSGSSALAPLASVSVGNDRKSA